ncbi:hypothetical protein D7X33_42100, partial [Butyricicoccus sp. 1XD8-22]
TPELDKVTFGSKEYKEHLKKVRVALEHHYSNNSHHPEHYNDGIQGMDLLDIVEMMCDWLASTMKHKGSNIDKSIELNKIRFDYSTDLEKILKNSVKIFNEERIEEKAI